jgi:hypothetical protein
MSEDNRSHRGPDALTECRREFADWKFCARSSLIDAGGALASRGFKRRTMVNPHAVSELAH